MPQCVLPQSVIFFYRDQLKLDELYIAECRLPRQVTCRRFQTKKSAPTDPWKFTTFHEGSFIILRATVSNTMCQHGVITVLQLYRFIIQRRMYRMPGLRWQSYHSGTTFFFSPKPCTLTCTPPICLASCLLELSVLPQSCEWCLLTLFFKPPVIKHHTQILRPFARQSIHIVPQLELSDRLSLADQK